MQWREKGYIKDQSSLQILDQVYKTSSNLVYKTFVDLITQIFKLSQTKS